MQHAGAAIKDAREAQGLSLRELAERAQVNAGYLSRVERGSRNPNPRWLASVIGALAENLGAPQEQQ